MSHRTSPVKPWNPAGAAEIWRGHGLLTGHLPPLPGLQCSPVPSGGSRRRLISKKVTSKIPSGTREYLIMPVFSVIHPPNNRVPSIHPETRTPFVRPGTQTSHPRQKPNAIYLFRNPHATIHAGTRIPIAPEGRLEISRWHEPPGIVRKTIGLREGRQNF